MDAMCPWSLEGQLSCDLHQLTSSTADDIIISLFLYYNSFGAEAVILYAAHTSPLAQVRLARTLQGLLQIPTYPYPDP